MISEVFDIFVVKAYIPPVVYGAATFPFANGRWNRL